MKKMKKNTIYLTIFVIALIFSSANSCFAHKVRIFAWENGDGTIMTESKFSGGRAAKNVTVTVIESSTGHKLLSGKTDIKGMYQFPIPKTTSKEIEIVVNGGDGHKNSWHYTLEETTAPPVVNQIPETITTPEEKPEQAAVETMVSTPNTQCDSEEFTRLLNAALDRKLAPIHRVLAESTDHSPTLQDILGGIGYILGLAGIAAYFQSRKKNQEQEK
jgi:nickel transport protein